MAETAFSDLGVAKFMSLSTFRKSGERVWTPVWVARDGDWLVVSTPRDSGKVKRIRNDPRVTMVPCTRFGQTDPGAQPVPGRADIVMDDPKRTRLAGVIRRKYRVEFPIIITLERLLHRRSRDRVILRISAV
jgi:PPOX class probable F420-dependent enzyme